MVKRRKTKAATRPARVLVSRPSDRRRGGDDLNVTTPYGAAVAAFAGRVRKAISRFSW